MFLEVKLHNNDNGCIINSDKICYITQTKRCKKDYNGLMDCCQIVFTDKSSIDVDSPTYEEFSNLLERKSRVRVLTESHKDKEI